jgi:hypothetical protein
MKRDHGEHSCGYGGSFSVCSGDHGGHSCGNGGGGQGGGDTAAGGRHPPLFTPFSGIARMLPMTDRHLVSPAGSSLPLDFFH